MAEVKNDHFRLVMAIDVGDLKQGKLNCLVGTDVDNLFGESIARSFAAKKIGPDSQPSLLLSYYHLAGSRRYRGWRDFQKLRPHLLIRDWQLDSGAFSAHTLGASVDLAAFRDFALEALATDPKLLEVFSLDVIGDWRASERNAERLWAAGVPVIPTYHVGEPTEVLLNMARTYPKIALGGAVGLPPTTKREWARQCLARVWPKPVHGLGFGGATYLKDLPLSSADSTNVLLGPCRFGTWTQPGRPDRSVKLNSSVPASLFNLRIEIETAARLERSIRAKWWREGAALNEMLPADCREWKLSS